MNFLSKLPPKVVHELAKHVFYRRLGEGVDIVKQGERGDELFMLVIGEAIVLEERKRHDDDGGADHDDDDEADSRQVSHHHEFGCQQHNSISWLGGATVGARSAEARTLPTARR